LGSTAPHYCRSTEAEDVPIVTLYNATKEEIMRRFYSTAPAFAAAAVVALSASYACAQEFVAHLTGFNEIGEITGPYQMGDGFVYTGAILSPRTATAQLYLDQKARVITYQLTYPAVGTTQPPTGTVTQAHIHFGKPHSSGAILVFLCTNLSNGPAGTPPCPTNGGTVTGTWTQANVLAIPAQNVPANDFDALVDALISNTAYANIHTTAFPGGEIRGQCHAPDEEHDHDHGQ
jgi:hypothetical protein